MNSSWTQTLDLSQADEYQFGVSKVVFGRLFLLTHPDGLIATVRVHTQLWSFNPSKFDPISSNGSRLFKFKVSKTKTTALTRLPSYALEYTVVPNGQQLACRYCSHALRGTVTDDSDCFRFWHSLSHHKGAVLDVIELICELPLPGSDLHELGHQLNKRHAMFYNPSTVMQDAFGQAVCKTTENNLNGRWLKL